MARKRQSKPSGPRRHEEQHVRDRLAHAQDDAQRLDLIATEPEELLKPARVDPLSQSEPRFPALIGQAIRRGWAVPDEKKPGYVDELGSVLEDPEATAMAKVLAFNALVKGDQVQHEKDQEYIRIDRVLSTWRAVLETLRVHIKDQELLKVIVGDVIRLLPSPARTDNSASLGTSNE